MPRLPGNSEVLGTFLSPFQELILSFLTGWSSEVLLTGWVSLDGFLQASFPLADTRNSSISVHGNSAHASRRKQPQITQPALQISKAHLCNHFTFQLSPLKPFSHRAICFPLTLGS